MTLESTKEDIFLAKNPFDDITKKSWVHKMPCIACTAPDTTKTYVLHLTHNKSQKMLNKAKYGLKLIHNTISINIVTTIKVGISKSLKWCPKIIWPGLCSTRKPVRCAMLPARLNLKRLVVFITQWNYIGHANLRLFSLDRPIRTDKTKSEIFPTALHDTGVNVFLIYNFPEINCYLQTQRHWLIAIFIMAIRIVEFSKGGILNQKDFCLRINTPKEIIEFWV